MSQVNLPYSFSSSQIFMRSSCRLKLEMGYKMMIRFFQLVVRKRLVVSENERQQITILLLLILLCYLVFKLYL